MAIIQTNKWRRLDTCFDRVEIVVSRPLHHHTAPYQNKIQLQECGNLNTAEPLPCVGLECGMLGSVQWSQWPDPGLQTLMGLSTILEIYLLLSLSLIICNIYFVLFSPVIVYRYLLLESTVWIHRILGLPHFPLLIRILSPFSPLRHW